MPEEELDQAAVEETKEQPVENTQETTEERLRWSRRRKRHQMTMQHWKKC